MEEQRRERGAMLRRPHAGETDDDLLHEEEELMAGGAFKPSAKLVKVSKRKTKEPDSHTATGDGTPAKGRSKFARDQAAKKKKEGIVDNTVLIEAVSQEEKVSVLGQIIERLVPADQSLQEWHPTPSPQGFPKVPKLNNLSNTKSGLIPGMKKRSLYMQQLEKQGLVQKNVHCCISATHTDDCSSAATHLSQDPRLATLGTHSYIIKGDRSLQNKSEADEIHQESISRLASLSHTERIKEKQELLANLSEEQITFLQSLRKNRESAVKGKSRVDDSAPSHSDLSLNNGRKGAESTAIKCEDSKMNSCGENQLKSTSVPPSESLHKDSTIDSETRRVRFSTDVEMEVLDDGEIPESELPIPPAEARKWLHMDKVDIAKLQWMTNMPKPRPLKNNEGFIARFDFEGNILPYESDISYREGLHHHGEEPGRPGYSLDELFIFIRSQVLQQRHLGLRTLANILRNAKEGLYDRDVSPPVIQLIVEAGAVLLLRFALDDSSQLIYSEAVRGLYYLIASEPDEVCLAMAQPWVPAGLEPGISSDIHANEKTRQELDQEEQELKDFEVIKLDVIRALVRMDTHLRLRYLLETIKPSPQTVINILGILKRMVRHSLTAAWTVTHTPRLISTILENFLPHNLLPLLTGESVDSMTSVYGIPLRHALHLFRIIAAKGRQLAAILVNSHQIMSRILTYVSLEPSEISIPLQEALALSQEAYATWAVLLAYGLSKPQEAIASFYPLLVKQLVFYRDKVSINEETEENKFNYDVGTHMINALTRAVNVAATHSLLENRMKLNQGTVIGADGNSEVLRPPELAWNALSDLPHLVETCLAKWLTQLARSSETTFSALRLIGSCCIFLDAYYVKWKDQVSYSSEAYKKIQNLHKNIISPALYSSAFRRLIDALPSHSSFVSDLVSGTERDPNNLGSLGCVTFGGEVIPLLRLSSPHPMLLPFSNLLVSLHTLHPTLEDHPICAFLDSGEMSAYLEKVCQSCQQLSSQWLTRIETHFICNILQLACLKGCSRRQLYHETAMCMMPCIHKGDEHLIKLLLSSVICAPEFTSDLTEMSTHVSDLALNDYEPLKSPAIIQPVLSPIQLTKNICQSFKSIESELVSSLVSKREYNASAVLKSGVPFIINGITISQTEFPLVLDKYWPLNPIKYVFKTSQQSSQPQQQEVQSQHSSDQSSPEDLLTVTRCLQMAYLTLKHRRNITLSTTTVTAWIQHLSIVFLVANDMFLDANISSYLQGCIIELLRNKGYADLNVNSPPEGFNSLISWYRRMLEQFMGVSYGDSTFALFLLIPLQQYWPVDYRKMLWGDMSDALPFFRLIPEQVEQFIPIQQFLEPDEEDEGMILKYRSGIGSGIVTAARNTFFHRVAAHHVRQYFQREAEKRRTSA